MVNWDRENAEREEIIWIMNWMNQVMKMMFRLHSSSIQHEQSRNNCIRNRFVTGKGISADEQEENLIA